MKTNLRLVETTEEALTRLIAEQQVLSGTLRAVEQLIADGGRQLAKRRGVAFIRFEQLKQEFSHD